MDRLWEKTVHYWKLTTTKWQLGLITGGDRGEQRDDTKSLIDFPLIKYFTCKVDRAA